MIVGLPAPVIFAPMEMRKSARSTTSGSQAALSMTVMPTASVAAIIKLAVPKTVGPTRPPRKIICPSKREACTRT